jgi:hypothetical protein
MSFVSMAKGLIGAEVRFVLVGGLAARALGSSRLTDDFDICYEPTPENRARLAKLLASWGAYLRGVEPGLPFAMDAQMLAAAPIMTLISTEGLIDIMPDVAGVGNWNAVLAASESTKVFGVNLQVLSLSALIAVKRTIRRPKDLQQLPELEAMLALRNQR